MSLKMVQPPVPMIGGGARPGHSTPYGCMLDLHANVEVRKNE